MSSDVSINKYPITLNVNHGAYGKSVSIYADHAAEVALSKEDVLELYHALGDWLQVDQPVEVWNSWEDE